MYWSTGIQESTTSRSQARLVVVRIAVAQEVPGGVDEGVHRVGLAPRRPAALRAGGGHPVLRRRQGRPALGRVVLDLGQPHRKLVVRHRHHPVALAVHDRDRAAPVALPREQPVAQPVAHRALPLALRLEPVHDRLVGLAVVHPVEAARVDERPVIGAGQVPAVDDTADLQAEPLGELVVARVVRGHGHHGPGAVLHQHVVRHEHRDLLAVHRIGHGAPERHAGLLLVLVAAILGRLRDRPVHVLAHLGAVAQPQDVRDARAPGRRRSRRRACRAGW